MQTPYETKPEFKDAGVYTVYYKAERENAGPETGSATVAIAKLDLGSWGQKRVYAYDGTEKSRHSDLLEPYFTVAGTTSAAARGEYLMTCTLKEEYKGNVT